MAVEFAQFNHSELVSIAHNNDIRGASRTISRERLISAIRHHHDLPSGPMAEMRESLRRWLKRSWTTQLQMQVHDDGMDPDNMTCSDMLVIAYYLANKDQMKAMSGGGDG